MTLKISRSQVSTQPTKNLKTLIQPTQSNPTHGWTQPMTNSGAAVGYNTFIRHMAANGCGRLRRWTLQLTSQHDVDAASR